MTKIETSTVIEAILAEYPELNDFGFGAFNPKGKTSAAIAQEIAINRKKMLEARSQDRFVLAREWLQQFPKVKGFNRRKGTSYGLKHAAEPAIGYVTNGVFIAAAIAAGFQVERFGPNAYLNISALAWRL